jgi:two-component system response regulator HupR/HoxA
VLILGETGTGKELVARAIHEQSRRAGRSFVAVNCGALPDTLLESELFGHVRGAFTSADRDKRGLFEEAEGGTLLLDEIGDTSPAFQTKLLRALEAREIRPVGGTQVRKVDVRVLSATHRDLDQMVADGSFRQDLLYRLNTATLYVPPLRRRRVDIPFLAQHFAEEFGDEHARKILLDEAFLDGLARQDFPGNVRELRNAVERAIALTAPGEPVGASLATGPARAAAEGADGPKDGGTLRERLDQVEREALLDALDRFHGNRTRMAEALGLSRVGLRSKLRRHGLDGLH